MQQNDNNWPCEIENCMRGTDDEHALCLSHRIRLPLYLQQAMTGAFKAYLHNPMDSRKFYEYQDVLTKARAFLAALATDQVMVV